MDLTKIAKGKYVPENKKKYVGDTTKITYRSSWERMCMRWCDINPDVVYWGSEITQVKYRCGTDGQIHTYNIDFTIRFKNGKTLLLEIKPQKQTIIPKASKGKKKTTLLTEQMAWIKNNSKWEAAKKYAAANNVEFAIWTEITLRKLGFPL